jgi:hypothetical protein
LRFAFYGRISTAEFQDPLSSRQWQRENAQRLIAGRGVIVADFFDVGFSRRVPWAHRTRAAALLAAVECPDRGFDAIVVGEFERAFCRDQFVRMLPWFTRHAVAVWRPELGGPVDLADPVHQALVMMLGHQSQREILRSRFRTTAAMTVQVRDQGRHLGGRPPYGYLVDAGPHPNAVHARWGRRLHRLDLDPVTVRHVRWMFTQRIAGHSVAGIALTLNMTGVPAPSAHDPGHNPHRSGAAWTVRTVAAILANPRYTGRQVWNRQGTDHHETEPGKQVQPTRRPESHPPLESAGAVGDLGEDHPPAAGQRTRLHPRADGQRGRRAGRRVRASVSADWADSVREVWAAPASPLGPPPARLPMPTRPHHRQRTTPGPGAEPVLAGGHPDPTDHYRHPGVVRQGAGRDRGLPARARHHRHRLAGPDHHRPTAEPAHHGSGKATTPTRSTQRMNSVGVNVSGPHK